jgi:hypothetical protein
MHVRRIERWVPAAAVALCMVMALGARAVHACAVCWGSSPEHPGARGLLWGLLFLMAMPFTVAGTIGGWLLYRHRRFLRTHRADGPAARRLAAASVTDEGSDT